MTDKEFDEFLKGLSDETDRHYAFDAWDSMLDSEKAACTEEQMKGYIEDTYVAVEETEKSNVEIDLPKHLILSASELALDTDDIYEDKEALSSILSDFLSDKYGYCHNGFGFEVKYNANDEPAQVLVFDIEWDVDSVDERLANATERSVDSGKGEASKSDFDFDLT